MVGDLNVAAEPRDVHPSIEFDSLYDSRELELLSGLVRAYPDVWRRLHPHAEGCYTVWEERTSARAFNVVSSFESVWCHFIAMSGKKLIVSIYEFISLYISVHPHWGPTFLLSLGIATYGSNALA